MEIDYFIVKLDVEIQLLELWARNGLLIIYSEAEQKIFFILIVKSREKTVSFDLIAFARDSDRI